MRAWSSHEAAARRVRCRVGKASFAAATQSTLNTGGSRKEELQTTNDTQGGRTGIKVANAASESEARRVQRGAKVELRRRRVPNVARASNRERIRANDQQRRFVLPRAPFVGHERVKRAHRRASDVPHKPRNPRGARGSALITAQTQSGQGAPMPRDDAGLAPDEGGGASLKCLVRPQCSCVF